ncbi:rhodanese-like domain-containing protein [Winogradskyella maritima]|uniref:Rhodanese-like domain-containing protein n=1 Tax=Winogradskyella maritima TaxID=1517766 RepID=A0ABV8AG48_9FLAO|nr:rhodanese-like domain-containing protein [Winogradskyella maritima]
MNDLSQQEWTKQLNEAHDAVIIDVRTADEVVEGMIPEALHIDIFKGQGFVDEINELDKTKSYFVYCKSGGRSGQACAVMSQLGFEKAYNLVGGFTEWQGDSVLP